MLQYYMPIPGIQIEIENIQKFPDAEQSTYCKCDLSYRTTDAVFNKVIV